MRAASPADRPASGGWRLQYCPWILTSILGLGLLGFVGFLNIGLKAARWRWLLAAAAWFALSVGVYAVNWNEPAESAALGQYYWVLIIVVWVLQIIHQVAEAPAWHTWRATNPPRYERRAARVLGDAFAREAPRPTGTIDVNRASAAQLTEEAGLAPGWAAAVVAARERRGPYASVDELLTTAHLPSDVFLAVRDRLSVVGEPAGAAEARRGRRLDLA